MFLPSFSGSSANCNAAYAAAPEDIPTNRPSSEANLRLVRMASSLLTLYTRSTTEPSYVPGMNPAPIP